MKYIAVFLSPIIFVIALTSRSFATTLANGVTAEDQNYMVKMSQRLTDSWLKSKSRTKQRIKIQMKISEYGTPMHLTVVYSSGHSKLDKIALDMIKKQGPYGDIPDEAYTHETKELNLIACFLEDERGIKMTMLVPELNH